MNLSKPRGRRMARQYAGNLPPRADIHLQMYRYVVTLDCGAQLDMDQPEHLGREIPCPDSNHHHQTATVTAFHPERVK